MILIEYCFMYDNVAVCISRNILYFKCSVCLFYSMTVILKLISLSYIDYMFFAVFERVIIFNWIAPSK